jgi:hypothetical protein
MRLPGYTEGQERLRPVNQQGRENRVSADAFGARIGEGMMNLGRGIQDMSDAFAYRNEVVATNEARDATYAFRDQITQALYSADGGFLTREGMAAYNGQEDVLTRLTSAADNIGATLGERGRTLFNAEVQRLMAGVREQTYRHAQLQFRRAATGGGGGGGGGFGGRSGSRSSYAEDVVNNDVGRVAHDEELFRETLETALVNAEADGVAAGATPEAIRDAQDELVSRAYEIRIQTQAVEDPIGAMETFLQTREMIYAPSALELYQTLQPIATAEQARRAVDAMTGAAGGRVGEQGTPTTIFAAGEAAGSTSYDPPVPTPEGLGSAPVMPNWMTTDPANARPDMPTRIDALPDAAYIMHARANMPDMENASDADILATRGAEATERAAAATYVSTIRQQLNTLGVPETPANSAMIHRYGPQNGAVMLGHVARGTAGTVRLNEIMPELGAAGFGHTVASVYRRVESESRPVVSTPRGPLGNHEAMLEVANAHPNPVMREALIREIELRRNIAIADEDARQRSARQQVMEIVEQNGGRPELVPMDLQRTVGVAFMNEVRGAIDAERMGQMVSDENVLIEMEELIDNDPDRFMDLDLNEYGQLLSREDRALYRERQREMQQWRDDPNSMITDDDRNHAGTVAREVWERLTNIPITGTNAPEGAGVRYQRYLQQFRHQFEQDVAAARRPLTVTEIENLATVLLSPAQWSVETPRRIAGAWRDPRVDTFEGTLTDAIFAAGPDGGISLAIPIGSVPAADRERIRERLSTELGVESVSDDDIVQQYGNERLLSVGISPTIEFNDIPLSTRLDIQTSLATRGIQPTDDAVLEEYLTAAFSVAAAGALR